MRFSSIKFQIPFTILVFALSVIIITTLLLDNVTSNHLKENILERNLGTCEMIGEHIYLYLNDAKGTVSTAAKFASESNGNMEDIKREIFRIYDNFEYFDLIFFIDNDGYMLFSKPENEYAYKTFLKAVDSGRIIGSVRANVNNNSCYIGKLIVHPDYQNKGIGTALMNSIENYFMGCERYELFTGQKSVKNLYLYKKLGYKVFKEEKISEKLALVYLEKKVTDNCLIKKEDL